VAAMKMALVIAVLTALTGMAHAQDEAPRKLEGEPAVRPLRRDRSHAQQVGLHVQFGTGYRVLFPYDEQYCGVADKSVCTGRSPFFMDLGLSYGLSSSVELLADVRLGLEKDFSAPVGDVDGPRPLAFSFGLRLYLVEEGEWKFFTSIQGVAETTDYKDVTPGENGKNVEGTDWGVRNVNGVLFDFHDNFGAYLHFGETATFVSWMRFELHGGLGVQARFP
jgi:hypothetical protein